jgi:hypothetical protein
MDAESIARELLGMQQADFYRDGIFNLFAKMR